MLFFGEQSQSKSQNITHVMVLLKTVERESDYALKISRSLSTANSDAIDSGVALNWYRYLYIGFDTVRYCSHDPLKS